MRVQDLTEQNAKAILSSILDTIERHEDWSADTVDEILDCLQCDQGRLWSVDDQSRFVFNR